MRIDLLIDKKKRVPYEAPSFNTGNNQSMIWILPKVNMLNSYLPFAAIRLYSQANSAPPINPSTAAQAKPIILPRGVTL